MRTQLAIACLISIALLTPVARAQQPPPVNRPADQPETHVVQKGETLWRIAQHYETTVAALRRLNDLKGNLIRTGQRLVVRRASASTGRQPPASPEDVSPTAPAAQLSDRAYVVQPGETLFGIADRYGVSADTLWRLNDRPLAPLDSGRVLRLPSGLRGTHRVHDGESLSLIARRYGVSLVALRRANPDVRGNTIYTGQILRLPAGTPGTAPQSAPDTISGPVQGYPDAFAGRLTASGTPYDPDAFTVSHSTLPLGTVVLLTNPANGRRTFAVVNDRGPLSSNYLLEASDGVLRKLRLDAGSEQPIRLRVVD